MYILKGCTYWIKIIAQWSRFNRIKHLMSRKYCVIQISNCEKPTHSHGENDHSWETPVCKRYSPSWWPQVLLEAVSRACLGPGLVFSIMPILRHHCLCWVMGWPGKSVLALHWRTLPPLPGSGPQLDFGGCHLLFSVFPELPGCGEAHAAQPTLTWGWSLFKVHREKQHNYFCLHWPFFLFSLFLSLLCLSRPPNHILPLDWARTSLSFQVVAPICQFHVSISLWHSIEKDWGLSLWF